MLSVLALSSRFDGQAARTYPPAECQKLSVLALSSRFDGGSRLVKTNSSILLSVLALSSRFDGSTPHRKTATSRHFQYSLCRVVLMVELHNQLTEYLLSFQYSLCRVVLMGLVLGPATNAFSAFSTRSVESF